MIYFLWRLLPPSRAELDALEDADGGGGFAKCEGSCPQGERRVSLGVAPCAFLAGDNVKDAPKRGEAGAKLAPSEREDLGRLTAAQPKIVSGYPSLVVKPSAAPRKHLLSCSWFVLMGLPES